MPVPDSLETPEPSSGNLTEFNERLYARRCFPDVEQIVRRVREVRGVYKRLKRVYVMTNGKRAWVEELKEALMVDSEKHRGDGVEGEMLGRWEDVKSSRDLGLDWEQTYVAQGEQFFSDCRGAR